MPRIHVLPEDIANKIAAGEVVERPASVVKELLENAIDAGSRKIAVYVEGGGRKLIRVTDDGEGMAAEDARLAFGRHATSKLEKPDDLFSIRTLGFRGEALPSIASVSRLILETQTEDAGIGAVIEIAGGSVLAVREQAFPRGTRISVEDLFYNVPARRKFLRSESYELSQITTYCTHYALAFPGIHFTLHSGSFELLAAPPVEGYRERVFQVFGQDLLDSLVEYRRDWASMRVKIHLFASRPHVRKMNRNSTFFFINRRLVRDRILLHAISEAYRNILPSGTFPVAILFLEIPFAEVDVNVHPAKTEVRFRQQSFVHDAVRETILEGLRQDKTIIAMGEAASPANPFAPPEFQTRVPENWGDDPIARAPFTLETPARDALAAERLLDLTFTTRTAADGCGEVLIPAQPVTEFDRVRAEIRPIGQLRDSFIIALDSSGLVVIDQHVAHERVLFEAYVRQRLAGRLEVQRLLMPIVVEMPPRHLAIIENIGAELARNGFEVEPFGPRTIAIKSAPAILKPAAIEKLLTELLDNLERETQAVNIEGLKNKIAATVCCHAAIKINNPLDETKMMWLVGELMKTDVPTVCPHGRPIIVRYDLREIQKAFKRN